MVDRLQPVELHEIWENEAKDFTAWLADNCDVLSDHLGLELSILEREKAVGPFSVDLFATDASGRLVVIENQLERTDHDHLGKVLTYMANLDAKVAIWISPDPRPEHTTVIDYLNEIAPEDTHFYLVRLQAFRIADSDAAPLFSVESGPSVARASGGRLKKEIADVESKQYRFFERFLEKERSKAGLFANVSPVSYQSWLNAGAGKSGVAWSVVASRSGTRAELFLCSASAETNRIRFEALASQSEEIERAFGGPLAWEFKEGRKQQYIRSESSLGGLDDEERWPDIHDELLSRLLRLESALRDRLKRIP